MTAEIASLHGMGVLGITAAAKSNLGGRELGSSVPRYTRSGSGHYLFLQARISQLVSKLRKTTIKSDSSKTLRQ